MSLTAEDVKKIAHLARLNMSESDITLYTAKLSTIIDFVEQMKQTEEPSFDWALTLMKPCRLTKLTCM